jgi:CDP-diacylglycerol--glycerol-3-phosphate 3-phosphatidyltransferase
MLIPVIIALLLSRLPYSGFFAAGVFALAALTDSLDGYFARARGEESLLGELLDPLADKLLVIAALVVLVEVTDLSSWIAIAFIARELAVTGLRLILSTKNVNLPSSFYGKAKTWLQIIAITAWILRKEPILYNLNWFSLLSYFLMFAALSITFFSGFEYFFRNWGVLVGEKD